MFKKPTPQPDFYKLEEEISIWWKANKIFEKSIENRKNSKDYIFYDGPPFMSGMPHYAHLLSSIMKDIIPRYQTMKGAHIERIWGWDCHGLPIENKVEKELNLTGKKAIEEYGLDKFVAKCYEWNRVGIENWRWYIEKIGRWVDIDNAYRTMDQDYMESVWWVFKEIWQKDLIYKGRRTSLYSTDFETPVSDFEVSMDPDNYQDAEDIAVTVKFKLTTDAVQKLNSKINYSYPTFLLAWTTTPWTLPSNFALALNPETSYSVYEVNKENIILAKSRVEVVFENTQSDKKFLCEVSPKELEGLEYEQLFGFLKGGENDFKVYLSDYVTTEDGTGILHVAPSFGEADAKMGEEWGLSFLSDINDRGELTVGTWTGTYLREANAPITEELKAQNKLFKSEKYVHRLPFYRGKNPLIYKTQEDYFINVQKIRDSLISSNNQINWVPEHFKEGRFKYILESAPDWSISRSRSWGTAMPLWQNEIGEQVVVGSRDELFKLVNESNGPDQIKKIVLSLDESSSELIKINSTVEKFISSKEEILEINASNEVLSEIREKYLGETPAESKVKLLKQQEKRSFYLFNGKPLDLHRPFIDKITFVLNKSTYKRIPETLDVWMDSGSMPYAQFHYPFENKQKFEQSFPGDYISEYTGQIRAWFYVLHVLSNALFNKNAFKNVLVSGVMAGNDGRKMSKVYGNYPDPKETIIKYSGDALRAYLLQSPLVIGNDMNFMEYDLKMQVREFLIPLWNVYTYFVTYANIYDWAPREELCYNARENFDDTHPWNHIPFDNLENELDAWLILKLQKTIKSVGEDLDNYTLPSALRSIKALVADISKWYIRRSRSRFQEGEQDVLDILYYTIIETSKLLAPFTPFISEYIYTNLTHGFNFNISESVHLTDYPVYDKDFVYEYSNLSYEMEFVQKVCDIGNSLRTQKAIKVRQPLLKLDVESLNETIPILEPWMREIIKEELNVKEVLDSMKLKEDSDTLVGEDSAYKIKVGLFTKITDDLKSEGILREIVRFIQATRKKSGFEQGDLINIQYFTDSEELKKIIEESRNKLEESVSAKAVNFNSSLNSNNVLNLEGKFLKIFLEK